MRDGSRFDRCSWRGCETECVDEILLCWYHYQLAGRTFIEKRSIFGAAALADRNARREQEAAERPKPELTEEDWWRKRGVVYYVRTGEHVKIGYTIHLGARISSLRLDKDALLAVEPGWREQEAERHALFADERQGRRENFNPSRRLLAHIDVVRAKYGEPWAYAKRRIEAAGPYSVVTLSA